MTLVYTVSYYYQVNGFSSRRVFSKRGIKQGDRFYPYLFILVFDILSRLITNAECKGLIQGIKLTEIAPSLIHLFFVDDAILFTRDSTEEVYQFINILNVFTNASD